MLKDTDVGKAAHTTRASSVNKLTSTSRTYVAYFSLSNTHGFCEVALNYFQLMDDKITPLRKRMSINQSGHIFLNSEQLR